MSFLYLDELKALFNIHSKRKHQTIYTYSTDIKVMSHWAVQYENPSKHTNPENLRWRLFYKGYAVLDCVALNCTDSLLTLPPYTSGLFSKKQYRKIIEVVMQTGQANMQDGTEG